LVSGEPLLFSVGGTQPKVTLEFELAGGGGVPDVVEPGVLEPDVVDPELDVVDPDVVDPEPDVVDPDVVEPVDPLVEPDEPLLPLVGAVSATVAGAVELVLLVAALDIPESLLPQPASAIARLPINVNPTKRPTRSAFCMHPPI
jgi:hypothetical protein